MCGFWMMYELIYVLCEVAIVSQLFIPFLFITWDCVKMTLLATIPQCGYASKSCLDTWEIYPHRGCYKLVMRAIPDLGAPCLIESLALLSLEKCFESFRILYIGELGILFTPQSLRRSGEAS